ncbi:uncharacterized protein J3R85_000757 [Psidium guajava]|nr:uncharacterized protein J3R85_000757 [Psidium guajava]
MIGAPEDRRANFAKYFIEGFWSNLRLAGLDAVLLPHGGVGDRPNQVKRLGVHEEHRTVDGEPESRSHP